MATKTLCACGCGEVFDPVDARGRPRRYIYGHQGRNQPHQRAAVACEHCGATFQRPQWHMRRVKHHFCSQTCEGLHAQATGRRRGANNGAYNTLTVPCAGGCGATVSKAASLIQRRNGRVYCPGCAVKFCRKGRPGFYVGYPKEFSATLRSQIRKRDGYACQECGRAQAEAGTLHVHHIDYVKTNNASSNLIALCAACHGRTNYAPDHWQTKYRAQMIGRGL